MKTTRIRVSAQAVMSMARVALIGLGFASLAAAQATATIAGTVKDTQGAVVAGAALTLTSETRGSTFPAVSGSTGDFIITNLPGDTSVSYTHLDVYKRQPGR